MVEQNQPIPISLSLCLKYIMSKGLSKKTMGDMMTGEAVYHV
jgi:hypothetical protein